MSAPEAPRSRSLADVLMRVGLVAILTVLCFRVVRPFFDVLLWSLILAISLYPLHARLRARVGDGVAAALLVSLAIAVLLVPVYFLGSSLAESSTRGVHALMQGEFHLPPPPEAVAGWPLIGRPLHDTWLQASSDLSAWLQRLGPQLRDAGMALLAVIAGFGMSLLSFLAALILAGVFMAFGESGSESALRVFSRLSDPERGARMATLCAATIRAVAQGVVGIAFIQSLLLAVGFVLMGIPGAGLLALLVLLFGIMQLPVVVLTLPVIAYAFFRDGTSVASIVFAIYTFAAGLIDNVLKPLMLGRGLAVPMPVVLIGALGGMVSSGLLGLFIGPVVLALGYTLFWQWVDEGSG